MSFKLQYRALAMATRQEVRVRYQWKRYNLLLFLYGFLHLLCFLIVIEIFFNRIAVPQIFLFYFSFRFSFFLWNLTVRIVESVVYVCVFERSKSKWEKCFVFILYFVSSYGRHTIAMWHWAIQVGLTWKCLLSELQNNDIAIICFSCWHLEKKLIEITVRDQKNWRKWRNIITHCYGC